MTAQPPPVSLRKRAQFQALTAQGKKWVTPAFVLQMGPRGQKLQETEGPCGFGLTASKKTIGIAVRRNRARRRLRALAREILSLHETEGLNFVLIAREAALSRSYDELRKDLRWALRKLGVTRGQDAQKQKSAP